MVTYFPQHKLLPMSSLESSLPRFLRDGLEPPWEVECNRIYSSLDGWTARVPFCLPDTPRASFPHSHTYFADDASDPMLHLPHMPVPR